MATATERGPVIRSGAARSPPAYRTSQLHVRRAQAAQLRDEPAPQETSAGPRRARENLPARTRDHSNPREGPAQAVRPIVPVSPTTSSAQRRLLLCPKRPNENWGLSRATTALAKAQHRRQRPGKLEDDCPQFQNPHGLTRNSQQFHAWTDRSSTEESVPFAQSAQPVRTSPHLTRLLPPARSLRTT